jgi:transcriptional regulator with XRE-family HTH domain
MSKIQQPLDNIIEARNAENKPDPIDVYVGQRMRLRRTLMGMSQEKLGEFVGLTFQQIQKYERGINRMGASRLYRLAQALGVSVAYFFEEIPQDIEHPNKPSGMQEGGGQTPLEGQTEQINDLLQRRETMELFRAYYRITDLKQRRKIFELIKSMHVDENAA